ncbi:MAG: nucleoside 2-deoxyribosyltransferase domain-containing protein [Polyangiaceae bacterium]|nr:nucleoside 2-deoxyribosyltransferase domain-containing protein [Polyangiaceae bacterium]
MKELRPPDRLDVDADKPRIFLAGSIEMGKAVDWQSVVTDTLRDMDIVVLNPRREAWDSTWPQSADFPPFREQVEWELDALEKADLILFYFAPETKSPITLLELGLNVRRNVIVCCPEGYWRKGNVDVVCRRYGIPQVPTLEALIERVRERGLQHARGQVRR